jgi:hypothetical protein
LFTASRRLQLWRYEDIVAKHELRGSAEETFIVWEIEEHRSHNGDTGLARIVECCVEIGHQAVSSEDSLTDHLLDTISLKPWLSLDVVDGAVGPEERVEKTQLVELDVEVLGGHTLISRYVTASEEHS